MLTAAPTANSGAEFERCGADDQFHDYVLTRYEPRAPALGKLRSVNLLYASFRLAGIEARGRALVEHVRRELGSFRTVFGVKFFPGAAEPIRWEFYFYDLERVHADLSMPRLVELFSPFVAIDAHEPWTLPWLMLSVSLGAGDLSERGSVPMDVYVDMRSYKARGRRWELENLYTFHEPRREIDAIVHRMRSLVHFDAVNGKLSDVLHPDLLACQRFCVANKRSADAVYAARISTDAAARFLARHRWPAELLSFVTERGPELDHLFWDVGFDFTGTGGELRLTKSSIYGTF